MLLYAEYWKKQNTIYIPSVLQKRLKLNKYESYRSISQIDEEGNPIFKWEVQYKKAFQTPESNRNEFDKKIIKLHEKFQVTTMIFRGVFLRVNPIKNDANNRWKDNSEWNKFHLKYMAFQSLKNYRDKNLDSLSEGDKIALNNQISIDSLKLKEYSECQIQE